MKPLNDWIITKPFEMKKENKSLVIIPQNAKKEEFKHKYVEVVAIGPSADESKELKVGDIVLVPAMSGLKVTHEGNDYEMAKVANMICVVGNNK